MKMGRGDPAALRGPVVAIALALVVGGGLIALAGRNPLSVYAALLDGTLGSAYGIGQSIAKATPLLFTGLAVAVAFRAGLFNVGAEGQMIAGGLVAALAGLAFPDAPRPVLLPLVLIAAAAGGAATAAIPAWLRSARGVHEVISTIMLNFIAAAAAGSIMSAIAVQATVRTETIPEAARLPRLSAMFGSVGMQGAAEALRASPANAAILLALLAAALTAWMLRRTVAGFEMRAVGLSPTASATAGIDVARVTRFSFYLSGALAGLAGTSFVLGNKYHYETGFTAGAGFMGIAVALVGRNTPFGVVLASLLFGVLSHGGLVVNAEVSSEIVNVLQALIVLFLVCAMGRERSGARGAKAAT